ncbi:flagellar biosynthesis protein FlhF [Clostridium sp. SYSU_GA19001]|uniref:flagellar biosynthesis protein FlhF n=1 Tax=Clostridium caldaquaticum TaxID=2940653 RepID=UPI002077581A|nr:flagellar biosynthesis protein FlhF [Clostridium caldaquaticum]MCM8710985.1 flagellar biosynthesis protein FlhF [Clostridium caldaquaticum]
MIIKRYIVNSMNEAMTRIRYELGKDAVIISQRKIRKPGFIGFFSKKIIEVTAAVENVKKNDDYMTDSIEAIKKAVEKEGFAFNKSSEFKNEKTDIKMEVKEDKSNLELIKEMQEMKNLISDMISKTSEKTQTKSELEIKLENSDLNEKVIKSICNGIKSVEEEVNEIDKAKLVIENMVKISKIKMEGAVVLVGPTGVGKTTTIAKLAGRLSLIEKKKVGLITIDTYRIGAVEQLKTYADIMNIPFRIVFTLNDMEAAIESMSDCDVILIDTTGRNSKNSMQISELRAFVEKVNTENIHLVLSCTTKNSDLDSIIQGYSILNFNNIIITKLDETTTYGSILNILEAAKKPLSFITTGQNVPDDIKFISASEVSSLILGEDSIC